jgi:hypothetical protein
MFDNYTVLMGDTAKSHIYINIVQRHGICLLKTKAPATFISKIRLA